MTQRQGETLVYINGQLANTVNAPEFNFNKYTTMPIRRIGDTGDVVKQSFNKLQDGHEFPLIFDYQATPSGVQEELFNAIADDEGVTVRVAYAANTPLNARTIAGTTSNISFRGMTVNGDNLYVCVDTDTVYRTNKNTGLPLNNSVLELHPSNNDPIGIYAVNDSNILVVDRSNRRLYNYTMTGNAPASIFHQLSGVNTAPSGLWGNSTTVWVSDGVTNVAYAYTYTTSQLNRLTAADITLTPPNSGAGCRSITGFGNRMYALFNDDTVGVYNIAGNTPIVSENLDLSRVVSQSSKIGTTDGKVLYLGDNADDRIYRINLKTGSLVNSTIFNAIVLNAPIITTDPNDPSGVEQVTYNLKINGQIL